MADPFRNDLESAHAHIARLEGENARLREELDARMRPKRGGGARAPYRVLAIGVAALVLLTGGVMLLLYRRPSPPLPPPASAADKTAFLGIATATDPDDQAKPRASVARGACNCAPGDPLCSCTCDPPFVVGADGTKRIKPECLSK